MRRKMNFWPVLALLIGVVLGDLIGRLTQNVEKLKWLAFGHAFGLSDATVDLGLLQVTFGFHINITVAAILGLLLAALVYRILR